MNGQEFEPFLTDDPFLQDVNCFFGGNIPEGFDNFSETLNQPPETDHDFWNILMSDVLHDDNPSLNIPGSLETDSRYTDSSSPHSSTSSSENDAVMIMDSVRNGVETSIDLYPVTQDYSTDASTPNLNVTDSGIDLGADVVVFTSEASVPENNCKPAANKPLTSHKSLSKLTVGRKRKYLVSESNLFDSVSDMLNLTEDERKLIEKEGLVIPTHLPLTRAEEKELKRIRRKIRNKLSAQESRKRKKEYVDGLEHRVKTCTSENMRLQKKVEVLENHQRSLLDKIKSLQAMISNTGSKTVQTSTCLLILLVSFAFLLLPSLFSNTLQSKITGPDEKEMPPPKPGPSRVLLSSRNLKPIMGPENLNDIKVEQFTDEFINASLDGDKILSRKTRHISDDFINTKFGPLEDWEAVTTSEEYDILDRKKFDCSDMETSGVPPPVIFEETDSNISVDPGLKKFIKVEKDALEECGWWSRMEQHDAEVLQCKKNAPLDNSSLVKSMEAISVESNTDSRNEIKKENVVNLNLLSAGNVYAEHEYFKQPLQDMSRYQNRDMPSPKRYKPDPDSMSSSFRKEEVRATLQNESSYSTQKEKFAVGKNVLIKLSSKF